MLIRDIIEYLEQIAPPSLQESYDNAGLITGNANWKAKKALICLDAIEVIVDEAIEQKCNLIIAHHPIVFRGLKRFNGTDYVQRTIIKAIKNDIAIYAIHTNLDNVFHNGVNQKIAEKLGLNDCEILSPKVGLERAIIYSPIAIADRIKKNLETIGESLPGASGYDFSGLGISNEGGRAKIDFQYASQFRRQILKQIDGFGKEISYDIIPLANINTHVGSGIIGYLKKPVDERDFMAKIKKKMKVEVIRHTTLRERKVRKVAICGGSGSFLLRKAKACGADMFITADFKYHEFFDAEQQIVIADIGHYETEQYTIELLERIINEKFSTFATYCTAVNTNPVQYF